MKLKSDILNRLGVLYLMKQDYIISEKYYRQSLLIKLELNNRNDLAIVYNNLGNLFNEEANFNFDSGWAGQLLLGRGRHPGPAHRQERRRLRQAEGQEDRPGLSRQPVRQGADSAAHRAQQDARLRALHDPRHPPRRRAESGLAADSPEQARLCLPVGLGRDELHRRQGSASHWLPARKDVRRVVGRCRA